MSAQGCAFKTVHNVFVLLAVCRLKCGNVLDVVLDMYFIAFCFVFLFVSFSLLENKH